MSDATIGRRNYYQTDKFCNVADSHGGIIHQSTIDGYPKCDTKLISIRYTDEKINCILCLPEHRARTLVRRLIDLMHHHHWNHVQ